MNTKFSQKIFRTLIIMIFVLGAAWMPTAHARAWPDPSPVFMLNVQNDSSWAGLDAWNWPLGSQVTLIVDDLDTLINPDYTEVQTMVPGNDEWHLTHAMYMQENEFEGGLEFTITLSDGVTTKTGVVSLLAVTGYDTANDTITGVSDPFMPVTVACAEGVEPTVIADSDGNWLVNFRDQENPDEIIYDIKPGVACEPQIHQGFALVLRDWYVPSFTTPTVVEISAPLEPIQIDSSIAFTVLFSDPDHGDTHTVTWDWGDGLTRTRPASMPSVTTYHFYSSPGVYTVTATITDQTGRSASATFQYVVIYDPNGGFVTGGGWITSPLGAYMADPTLTGKATFGFVSKYQKGANVPAGTTEFQFHVADMNLKSTSYDWLVIAGTKAQYKGTGTINGAGEYKFILTAIDGSPDKFRIKIWNKATGEVIYDNMLGAVDTADPSTVIGGGSIVIHKPK